VRPAIDVQIIVSATVGFEPETPGLMQTTSEAATFIRLTDVFTTVVQNTPGKDLVSILQEVGWAPGPVWKGGKSPPHRNSIPDRPARSQSLNRLSYLTH